MLINKRWTDINELAYLYFNASCYGETLKKIINVQKLIIYIGLTSKSKVSYSQLKAMMYDWN